MTDSPFADLNGLPFYDEPALYIHLGGMIRGWEFGGWKRESMSWKTGCYIHTGLSGPQFRFEGPDVAAFFASICSNSFAKFPIGSMKHGVMCNEAGLVATHGILQRNAEEEYRWFAAGPWPMYQLAKTSFNVTPRVVRGYLTQIAGPRALDALERATGEDLRDISFLRFRNTRIAGKTVEIGRIGMAGNLAFEVRGPMEEGPAVYDAIFKAGRDFGMERLGWRTYLVNHVEGGFPQQTWTFCAAQWQDPGFLELNEKHGFRVKPVVSGSVDPANLRARQRSPLELNWQGSVRFDHDFIGRQALETEAANPRRKTVTLRWNADDVIDIHASLLRKGEEYKTMDLPTTPTWLHGTLAHADHIRKDGREVGYASGTIYSYYFREVLSMGVIDIDQASIGNEVIVQWGDHGHRIKDVRATVERFPYMQEGRNDQIDLTTLAKQTAE
jgi:vanillate/3-O-methylgallate O-demethylase